MTRRVRWMPALLTVGLLACTPTVSRAEVSAETVFMPGGQQLALICASHARVAGGGGLVWDAGQPGGASFRENRQAPYLISCHDYTLKNDGATLSVQDDTLARALTHFDPGASLLHYYADLSLTFPAAGLVSADSTQNVPEAQLSSVRGVSVVVSQPGTPDAVVVQNGAVTAQRYDPARPLIIRLRSSASPVEWPEVTVQASKGLITAPIYR